MIWFLLRGFFLKNLLERSMANQLSMDKTLAITHLNQQGMSQRAIARALGVSRGAVIRHLRAQNGKRYQSANRVDRR
jgi:IS30 family transposase